MTEKKNTNKGYQFNNQRNNGYQPTSGQEHRGYQPKPDGNFGYQPSNKSSTPPSPPTSGSNAVMPKNK